MIIKKEVRPIQIEKEENHRPEFVNWGTGESQEVFEKNQKVIKIMVKKVLEFSEEARGNDLILFFECIRLQYPNIKIENKGKDMTITIPNNLIGFLKPENYRRQRQKFNENDEYLPSSPVILRRRCREKAYKKFFSKVNQMEIKR